MDSDRVLHVDGGYNFRDLGGLKTSEGKLLKKDLLFRTDELNNLSESDLELLASLNIQTVVDFRTDEERAKSIDKIPSTCKNEVHLDILSANMDAFVEEMQKEDADFKKLMLGFYSELVLSANAITQFVKFFELLQNADNLSVIYHCSAGKDRTGVATALILDALQVTRKDIEEDYLMSNEFLKDKYAAYINQNPKYADLFLVQADYLKAAFDAIEEKYDSVANYLTSILKVDLELIRKIYLED